MTRSQAGNRITTWLLALALLVAQSGLPTLVLAQAADQAGSEQVAEQLQRGFAALEAAAREIPRDSFDTLAVLSDIGLDAGDAFAWVRDRTYLVPYRGALRGPTGVLMDRVGNSLDRALLLNELLLDLGFDTRLARAQLTPERAQQLLESLEPWPLSDPMVAGDAAAEVLRYVDEFGLDEASARAIVERLGERSGQLAEDLARRVPEQSAFLAAAVGGSVEGVDALRAEQADALRDHWWVQVLDGGAWLDLDPSLPAAEPGETLADADELLPVTAMDELAGELLHTVQVRVVLECRQEGALSETTLVESPRLLPAELLAAPVVVQTLPLDWPQDLDLTGVDRPDELLMTTLLAQSRWAPLLRVGGEVLIDGVFDDRCEVSDASQALSALGVLGDTVSGALGGVLDTLEIPEAGGDVGPALNALWLEYLIGVPGQPDRIVRRPIVDLLGPAARAAGGAAAAAGEEQAAAWRLALMGRTEILPLVGQLAPAYVEHLSAQRLLAQKDVLLALAQRPEGDELQRLTGQIEPLSESLYALALGRDLAGQPGIYLDRPNILSQHTQLSLGAEGQLRQLLAYDIVVNDVAVHPAMTNAFSARLHQGVRDTNLEALLGAQICRSQAAPSCDSYGNPAEALAQSGQDAAWLTLRRVADLEAQAPYWPQDALARVRADLAAGFVVVLPDAALAPDELARASWWRIDPASGTSLGIGGTGWGTETVEYSLIKSAIAITGGLAFCLIGSVIGGGDNIPGSVTLCSLGTGAGVGAVVAGGPFGVALALISVLMLGVGGLGVLD